MNKSIVGRIVGYSSRHAGLVVLVMLLIGAASGNYAKQHFKMDSRTEALISSQTPWRKREAVYDAAFPEQNQVIDVVVDGATPERAEEAAASLTEELSKQRDLLPVVRRPDDGNFFERDGLLFLPTPVVQQTMQQEIAAQAFLGALASDPSLRGVADNLSTALLGVQRGQAKLADLDRPMKSIAQSLNAVLAGEPGLLSWRSLLTGAAPSLRETRRFIEIRPRLEFGKLMPGSRATMAIRDAARRLNLDAQHGISVRLTGPVPMTDDEFGTLVDRARLMATLMMLAVLTMLWFAVRSARLIFAILLTVFTGLAITTAVGLLAVGAFNLISVAFIALFVGLGVDFGIQFCVRYRAERHERQDLNTALVHTGSGIGSALTLAAAATAAGFYSFLPTSYRGVAELGFVAGTGMLITYVLSISLLPALVKLLSPPGEPDEIGFRQLAPLDQFLQKRKRPIVLAALAAGIVAASTLSSLEFDFNPLDLRSPKVESVATALELMKDPDTSPNTLNILTPSHGAAVIMAKRLSALPQVSQALTVDSFVPDAQGEKISIIADAHALLDPTLNPFMTQPPPDDAAVVASFAATARALQSAAGTATDAPARHARDLAAALQRLSRADTQTRARAEQALVPGLKTMLDQVRNSLEPYPVTANVLPRDLVRDWVSPGGLYRVEATPKGNSNDNGVLRAFTTAVRRVAPEATGTPLLIQEAGRTIVRAFLQAGILSFVAITILLYAALRSIALVALALGPLVLSGIATLATCVAIGLPLNYANIIALPLLLGIGVAFDIYFVMAWRSGVRNLLGSSLTRAVILSAGTTASAFGTLWMSSHPGTASMGELLAISLGWILISVLFLLPALLGLAVPNIGLNGRSAVRQTGDMRSGKPARRG